MAGRRRPRVEHKEEEDPFADFFKETASTHQHALAVDPFEAALSNLSGKNDRSGSSSGAPLVRSGDEQKAPQEEKPVFGGEDLLLAPKPRRRLGQPKEEEPAWNPFSHQRASPAPITEEEQNPAEELKETAVASQQEEQNPAEELKETAVASQQEYQKEEFVEEEIDEEVDEDEKDEAATPAEQQQAKPELQAATPAEQQQAKPELQAATPAEQQQAKPELQEATPAEQQQAKPELQDPAATPAEQQQAKPEFQAATPAEQQQAKPELQEVIDQTEKSIPVLRRASRNSPRAVDGAVQLAAGAGLEHFMEEELPVLPDEEQDADAAFSAESEVRLDAAPEQSTLAPQSGEQTAVREEDEADAEIEEDVAEELEDEGDQPQDPPPQPVAATPLWGGGEEAAKEVPVEVPAEVPAEVPVQVARHETASEDVPQSTEAAAAGQAEADVLQAPADSAAEEKIDEEVAAAEEVPQSAEASQQAAVGVPEALPELPPGEGTAIAAAEALEGVPAVEEKPSVQPPEEEAAQLAEAAAHEEGTPVEEAVGDSLAEEEPSAPAQEIVEGPAAEEDAPKEVLDEQREQPQAGTDAGLPDIVVTEPAEAERTQRPEDGDGDARQERNPVSTSETRAYTADGEATGAAFASKEAALRQREGALRAREDALARREQALDVREAELENARRHLQEQLQRRNQSDTDSADAGGSTGTFRPALPPEPKQRNGRRPAPRIAEPRLPNPDKVFSDKALEKRALRHYEHQIQKALASAQMPTINVPKSPVSLDKLPASTREHLLKSAREEADRWYQAEEQRARATYEQQKVQTKLQEWYEQREAARDAEQKRKTAEAEEAAQAEREERMRWQRRQEMLKRKVADWACEKAEREEKSEREAEEANRAAQAADKRRQLARKERMRKMLEQRYRNEEEA